MARCQKRRLTRALMRRMRAGPSRQAELRIDDILLDAGEHYAVQQVGGIEAHVHVDARVEGEPSLQTAVERERLRSAARVSSGVAEDAGRRCGVRRRIEIVAGWHVVGRYAGEGGATRRLDVRRLPVQRRERQAAAGGHPDVDRPVANHLALPAVEERAAAQADAGVVGDLRAEQMALIERRRAFLGVQIQPVLRRRRAAAAHVCRSRSSCPWPSTACTARWRSGRCACGGAPRNGRHAAGRSRRTSRSGTLTGTSGRDSRRPVPRYWAKTAAPAGRRACRYTTRRR